MKIPAEFEDILRGVELTERETLFLSWITSWDDYTIQNMRTVVEKVRSALSTLQAENEKLRAAVDNWKKKYVETNGKWIKAENKWAGLDKAVRNGNVYRPMQEELNLTHEENQSLKYENEKLRAELEQVKREQCRIPKGYALVKLELLEELDNFRDLGPIDRLRELAQADREERCVVLDMPRKPLAWGDDEQNTCLCPCCGRDLVGIPYGERMVLQCPECGQYLDATKVIAREEAEAALRREQGK